MTFFKEKRNSLLHSKWLYWVKMFTLMKSLSMAFSVIRKLLLITLITIEGKQACFNA